MTYDASLDNTALNSPPKGDPARNWYTLASSDIGAKELPNGYGRALMISVGASVVLPLLIVVVPLRELDDSKTRTITITQAGERVEARGVRRIVSVAGGTTVPAGVQIDVVTG